MDPATLIAAARRRSGLSQRELAARAGTSAAAICLYESGSRIPRVDTLARLLAATGTTLELRSRRPLDVDLAANGRDLVELLEVSDRLPTRSGRVLEAPVLAHLVR